MEPVSRAHRLASGSAAEQVSYAGGAGRLYWVSAMTTPSPSFEEFVRTHETRLRTALVLTYGPEAGRDATAEALAYAWEHWDRVSGMAEPVGYLYRVGQSRTRGIRRRPPDQPFPPKPTAEAPWVEPKLSAALNRLSEAQRVCTVLVCSFDWHLSEVAELLEVSKSTVQSHVERGLKKLRVDLEVIIDG